MRIHFQNVLTAVYQTVERGSVKLDNSSTRDSHKKLTSQDMQNLSTGAKP